MKTLLVYDNDGKIWVNISGDYAKPNGLPYIETDVPAGYYAESVNMESKQPVLRAVSQSPQEKALKVLWAAAMLDAEDYTDAQAVTVPTLYPEWEAGIQVEPGDRYYRTPVETLYKVREGKGHTTQEGWEPENMADSWEVIDVTHAGTKEDPIPAKPNMQYYNGKFYRDEGMVYQCTRDTEMPISQMPHELVGIYFQAVESEAI